MATIIKLLCTLFVLSLIGQGNCQCSLQQVTISQTKTSTVVQGKPVWEVTISNGCPCSQTDLQVSCKDFQTVTPVDPSVWSKSGDLCLVNNGNALGPSYSVNFTYAWDTSFSLFPFSSQINCS